MGFVCVYISRCVMKADKNITCLLDIFEILAKGGLLTDAKTQWQSVVQGSKVAFKRIYCVANSWCCYQHLV